MSLTNLLIKNFLFLMREDRHSIAWRSHWWMHPSYTVRIGIWQYHSVMLHTILLRVFFVSKDWEKTNKNVLCEKKILLVTQPKCWTTKKELMVVVFPLKKFLFITKIILCTDHTTLNIFSLRERLNLYSLEGYFSFKNSTKNLKIKRTPKSLCNVTYHLLFLTFDWSDLNICISLILNRLY